MIAFIKNNLKSLFTLEYFFSIFIYFSFAWFISEPPFDVSSVFNSSKLIARYDSILYSIAYFNFLFFILSHFKINIQKQFMGLLLTRFSIYQIFFGFVFSYVIFFIIGFVFPAYSGALLQQLMYSPQNINILIFLVKFTSSAFGFTFFWIIITLVFAIRFYNEFMVLLLIIIFYIFSLLLYFLSGTLLFNQFWILNISIQSILVWILFMLIALVCIRVYAPYLRKNDIYQLYKKSYFSKIFQKLYSELSMHHLNMLDFSGFKLIALFTMIGLFILISLSNHQDGNLIVMLQIYIGIFVPILFSFNQIYLINIDIRSGILHNIFLCKMPYSKLIFNRWFILLLPQISISILYFFIVINFVQNISLNFIIYIILLNILYSLINLVLSIFSKNGVLANFCLLFFVYIQLRYDIQFIMNNIWLKKINIFYPILQENIIINNHHWISLISIIFILMVLIDYGTRKFSFLNLNESF